MNIVSFGGGTNSAALIIGLYKHKIPIDLITFADTGAEHPHTYQFIEIINQWLARTFKVLLAKHLLLHRMQLPCIEYKTPRN